MSKRLTVYLLLTGAMLGSCSPAARPVSIPFAAAVGGSPIDCGTDVGGVQMTDLRFYVHRLILQRQDGERVPVSFGENGRWQSSEIALIDLEDARGECRNGTPDTNTAVVGTVPDGEYRGLSFIVSVPFEHNHADPLAAVAPLDDSTMHWHWRSGYKFLRLGFAHLNQRFWLHLGSAGCQGTVRNISGCRFSNRFEIVLDDYSLGDTVLVDLSSMITATGNEEQVITDCSSGPAESSCRKPFAVLGIDFSTGNQVKEQQLFVSHP